MRCPRCDSSENRVVDTRASRGGRAVRRRRECLTCRSRFTTYEYVEERPIQVLKQGGSSEEFDREKLVRAIRTACAKRPVALAQGEAITDEIEDALNRAQKILKKLDALFALNDEQRAELDNHTMKKGGEWES